MLKCVLELQGVVIKNLTFFRFILLGGLGVNSVSWSVRWSIYGDVRELLFIGFSRNRGLLIHLKSFFNPFLLVRVCTCGYHILFASCHTCLDVVAIGQLLPVIVIINFHRCSFGSGKYAHIVFPIFVASTASYTWLSKIHYLKCISLVLDAALGSKVKPLLVTSGVGVNLHEQIVCVLTQGISLGLKQVARLKHWIK